MSSKSSSAAEAGPAGGAAPVVGPRRAAGARAARPEAWISVDVEASGPTPSTGSLVAIGACLVDDPTRGFYAEIAPIDGLPWSEAAERVHGLTREHLAAAGQPPAAAMAGFAAWIEEAVGGGRPVFVAFNATFDWMFVADYFQRFLGRNPFGISGLDIKALYLGRHLPEGLSWADTRKAEVRRRYPPRVRHTHHALEDAVEQAAVVREILVAARAIS